MHPLGFRLAALWLAVLPLGGAARAATPAVLTLYAENNQSETDLSSAASGMPRVSSTFAAQLFSGADPASAKTVHFSVLDAAGNASGLLVLDHATAVTDADGKCFVSVTGAGVSVPDQTEVLVKAKRFHPTTGALLAMDTVRVWLRQKGSVATETPLWHNPIGTDGEVRYNDDALGISRSVAGTARGQWTSANEIAFRYVAPGETPDLVYQEVESPEPWFGMTYIVDPPVRRHMKIQINVGQLDPDRSDPPLGWTKWGLRGHLLNTSCHELGHALLLAHNAASDRSLLWPDVSNYFVWKTQTPRWDCDWPPVHGAY